MKPVRTILFSALLTILAFSTITYVSCKSDRCDNVICQNGGACNNGACNCPSGYEGLRCEIKTDPCDTVNCLNGGTCIDGSCNCPTGYEGTNCETKSSDKFIGVYTATEDCSSGSYTVTITPGSEPDEVLLSNLGNYGCSVSSTIVFDGTVNGNKIVVDDYKCNTQMKGTGTYVNGVITIHYTATYGLQTDVCVATLVKQ